MLNTFQPVFYSQPERGVHIYIYLQPWTVPTAASLGMAMTQCAKAWGLFRVPTLTHTTRRACSAACLGEIYRPPVPAAIATGCKKFAPPALFARYNIL